MAKKTTNGLKLVIVESPTKAKTIRKFLGRDYIVESCMGHIRDLPQSAKDIPEKFKKTQWAKLGVNVEKSFEPLYCIPKTKTKVVKELRDKLAQADELILATDEDREGESISWHLLEVLKPTVPVKRMVFHEITKEAIFKALEDFREIDFNLVRAQEARRILDRLVGYTISPLIWKKVAYGLSAGRVQSVAVRLICERELERLKFKSSQYWGVTGSCEQSKVQFQTRLLSSKGQRIATGKDFDGDTGQLFADKKDMLHLLQDEATRIAQLVQNREWTVSEVEEKPVSRKPSPPFITSTLQQESNRKLGLSARETMQVAQKLYEEGFITYMRTDSTFLSQQALEAARKRILQRYGKEYLPSESRTYQGKKVKGAQEAHEAIRPAGTEMIPPDDTGLQGMPFRLYDLIWKRTIASQMVNSQQKQVSVKFDIEQYQFAASGQVIEFAGFLKAYVESIDEVDRDDQELRLPQLKKGDRVRCIQAEGEAHETKPPARYNEASLVQTMEKEGIGRPSTYASIIGTIQDRGYVNKQGNALVPTFTAMIVSKLLSQYLPKYVDSGFTSQMEQSLDDIAEGDLDSVKYLEKFYLGQSGLLEEVGKTEEKIDPDDARTLKFESPSLKELSFKVGRFGAYVCRPAETGEACASLPDSQAPADITQEIANQLIDQKINGTDAMGYHPESKEPIYVLNGRYGPYVQLGDSTDEDKKPKRSSLPPGMKLEDVDLNTALFLVSLPKSLGLHPDTQKEVKVGIGRFGPYVVSDGDFRSVPKDLPLSTVDLSMALEIFSRPKSGRGRAAPIKELGSHPQTQEPIQIFSGKFGPYIKCGKVNVSVPEGVEPLKMTLEQAVDALSAKISLSAPSTSKAAKKASKSAVKSATNSKVKKVKLAAPAKKTAPIEVPPVKKIAVKTRKART